MSELVKITKKVSTPEETINQQVSNQALQSSRASKSKLLSPFTWSNINIKLPSINKKLPNHIIEEKPQIQAEKRAKSRKKSLEKKKLENINRTIDLTSMMKKQGKKVYFDNKFDKTSIKSRNQSSQFGVQSTNLRYGDKNDNNPNPQNMKELVSQSENIIKKFTQNTQKNFYLTKYNNHKKILQTLTSFSKTRDPIFAKQKYKSIMPNTFSINNKKIQPFIFKSLIKSGWTQKDTSTVSQLVWSSQYGESTNPNQLCNHIKNCNILTTKNSLHDILSANGSQNYPQSYLMPFQYQNFCEEYEQQLIKICLKSIVTEALNNNKFYPNYKCCLGSVITQILQIQNINEDSIMAIRICLYLQNYRKQKNYKYFQDRDNYILIQTKLQPSVLSLLLKGCYQYWETLIKDKNTQSKQKRQKVLNINNIQPLILQVLHGYHSMIIKYQQEYYTLSNRNLWIVKPIASSKGAGISLLKSSSQFLRVNNGNSYDKHEIQNKTKFANKIIQKYIQQPLLIKKIQPYADRKFDIRQWVLITCDKLTLQPLIYIFQDAYCRFSDMKFTYNHSKSQQSKIHLTNYSLSDKSSTNSSVLLLSQLFNEQFPQLQQKYYEQLNKIVVETIMNVKDIKFQSNRFQLLGYDLIFDINEKLWLLQINMNPACQTSRYQKLQNMANFMVNDMINIVKAASYKTKLDKQDKNGWRLVYGEESFREVSFEEINVQTKILPYFSVSLGKDSFVELVRKRNQIMNILSTTLTNLSFKIPWNKIKQFKKQTSEQIINPNQKQQNKQQNQQKNQKNHQQQKQEQKKDSPQNHQQNNIVLENKINNPQQIPQNPAKGKQVQVEKVEKVEKVSTGCL